jgi:hypothetical protein
VIIDGLIELVVSEIEVPSLGDEWNVAMRRRATSPRDFDFGLNLILDGLERYRG